MAPTVEQGLRAAGAAGPSWALCPLPVPVVRLLWSTGAWASGEGAAAPPCGPLPVPSFCRRGSWPGAPASCAALRGSSPSAPYGAAAGRCPVGAQHTDCSCVHDGLLVWFLGLYPVPAQESIPMVLKGLSGVRVIQPRSATCPAELSRWSQRKGLPPRGQDEDEEAEGERRWVSRQIWAGCSVAPEGSWSPGGSCLCLGSGPWRGIRGRDLHWAYLGQA